MIVQQESSSERGNKQPNTKHANDNVDGRYSEYDWNLKPKAFKNEETQPYRITSAKNFTIKNYIAIMNDNDDDTIPNMDNDTTNSEHYQIIIDFLRNNQSMKQTAVKSLRQGVITGGSVVVGSVLFGPLGGLVSGIGSSIYNYTTTPHYDGIVQQIIQMNDHDIPKRNQLLQSVRLCLMHAGVNYQNFMTNEGFQQTLYQYTEQREVRDQIWNACMTALS